MSTQKRRKGEKPTTPKLKRDNQQTLQRRAEILGLLRMMVVVAFVIQLMIEFGPHTVAP